MGLLLNGNLPAIFALLLAVIAFKSFFRGRQYPPGPVGLPFLGQVFRIPQKKPWETFWQWGQQYGPIYSFRVVGHPVIVINSYQVANDLFTRRSHSFSKRPFKIMATLCGYNRALTFLPLGNLFRKTRRLLSDALNANVIERYHSMQQQEALGFARRLIHNPDGLHKQTRWISSGLMLKFCLGYNVTSEDDLFMDLSEQVAKSANLILTPGQFWVESVPFPRFMPSWLMGSQIRNTVREFQILLHTLLCTADSHVQKCIAHEYDSFSAMGFRAASLRGQPEDSEDYDIVRFASISAYGGAVETTIAFLDVFFLAMIQYPNVQRKAQAEIDSAIGSNRLPTHADRPSLPYIDAILKEVLRWSPPIPMTSRVLETDEPYGDYLLPKGATVIANMWAMTHDDTVYPDAHRFIPERFVDCDKEESIDPFRMVFGFGRRFCPGKHFADASIWIAICTALAVFNISAPLDCDGKEKVSELDCDPGVLLHLAPFEYNLQVRSKDAADLCSLDDKEVVG